MVARTGRTRRASLTPWPAPRSYWWPGIRVWHAPGEHLLFAHELLAVEMVDDVFGFLRESATNRLRAPRETYAGGLEFDEAKVSHGTYVDDAPISLKMLRRALVLHGRGCRKKLTSSISPFVAAERAEVSG